MAEAATVWVSLVPSMRGMAGTMTRGLSAAGQTAGAATGSRIGRAITTSAAAAIPRSAKAITRGFDAVYSRAETMASTAGNTMARRIGAGAMATLGPIGRMRDGFRNADAAASAFSGRAGTVGGLVRRGVDTAVGPLGRMRDGYLNAQAAASSFSGRAGTFGGVVRRGVDTAGRGLGVLRGHFATLRAQAVADATAIAGRLRSVATIAGGAAAAGIGYLGVQAARTAIDVQKSTAALTGLYGSADKATAMMGRLRSIAAGSPINYATFVEGAKSLAYMGYEGDQATRILRRVETAMVASGKGSEAFGGVTEALLAMQNQGKASADTINQMSQAGFPAWEMLATHMKTSITGIRKDVETGKVSIDDMIAAMEAGAGPTFAKMTAAQGASANTLANVWARTKDNVVVSIGTMMTPLVQRLTPAVSAAGSAVSRAFAAAPGLIARFGAAIQSSGVGDALGRAFGGLRDIFAGLWSVAGPFFAGLAGAVGAALLVLGPLGDLLSWIGGLISGNAGFFGIFAAALGGFAGAVLVVRGALAAWALAQWAVNTAMAANPITLIVGAIAGLVAAVIYCWNHFTWFRTIITGAWNAIRAVVSVAWNVVLRPIFTAIGAAVRFLGMVIGWLWRTIVAPVFTAIRVAARVLFAVVVTAVVLPIVAAFRLLASVFGWVGRTVVMPIFRAIGAVAGWLWRTILAPAFAGIRAAFRAVGTAVQWVWRTVLKPVFDVLGFVIRKVGDGVAWMKDAFATAFKAIVGFVKKPIQVVIDIIWNNSIRWLFEKASKVPVVGGAVPDFLTKRIQLAKGGVVPGAPQPGKDRRLAEVSQGEGVLVPELVALIGPDAILAANKWAARNRPPGRSGASTGLAAAKGGIAGKAAAAGMAGAAAAPSTALAVSASGVTGASKDAAALDATAAGLTDTVSTLDAATGRYTTTVLGLSTTALTPLQQQMLGKTVPAFRQVERHAGTVAPAAVNRLRATLPVLGAQQVRTGNTIKGSWGQVTNKVVLSQNTMQRRQQSLQRQMGASWGGIATTTQRSVTRQRGSYGGLQQGMRNTGSAMHGLASTAGRAFSRAENATKNPLRRTIQQPINRGIITAYNALNRQFRFGKAVPWVPVRFAAGGKFGGRDGDGKVFGPGTGTSDSIFAPWLSRGEFTMREKITRLTEPFLRALNRGEPEALQAAGAGRRRVGLRRGGMLADTGSAANAALARGVRFARKESGKPYIWGGVGPAGYDCSGFMSAITNVLRGQNPHQRLGVARSQPWSGFQRGMRGAFATGYSQVHTAGTLAGTNVESGGSPSRVKFGTGAVGADDSQFPGHAWLPFVGGRFVSGGGGAFDPTPIVNQAFAKVPPMIRAIERTWPGAGGQAGAASANKGLSGAKKFALRKAMASFGATGSAGSPAVKNAVRTVAARYGWGSGAQWAALDWLINQESSWDPGAANPTSSARGLFQKMTSIHGPVERTPAAQAQWGLNYIRGNGNFSDPIGAKRFHQANNWYDTGGLWPPGTAGFNGTGRIERVLDPQQTVDYDRRVLPFLDRVASNPRLLRVGQDRRPGGDTTFNTYVTAAQADSEEVGEAVARRVNRKWEGARL